MTNAEKNLAYQVNQDCIIAFNHCPQSILSDDLEDLYKKGLYEVINFWTNSYTDGGRILYNKGYSSHLTPMTKNIFNKFFQLKEEAAKKIAEEIGQKTFDSYISRGN